MPDSERVHRAIALLTVVLDDEREPDADTIDAVAPDLFDAEQVEELIRGLAEVSAWLLIHLERVSGEPTALWLRRAALDFA